MSSSTNTPTNKDSPESSTSLTNQQLDHIMGNAATEATLAGESRLLLELSSQVSTLSKQVDLLQTTLERQHTQNNEKLDKIIRKLEGRFDLALRRIQPAAPSQPLPRTPPTTAPESTTEPQSTTASQPQSPTNSASPTPHDVTNTVTNGKRAREETGGESSRKKYNLCRSLKNVKSLWKEWTTGLEPDEPSVNSLNEEYGSSWRSEPKGKN